MSEEVRKETTPKEKMRAAIRGVYDLQELRIQSSNRIVRNFSYKVEESKGKIEIDKFLSGIRKSHKLISEGVTKSVTFRNFQGDGLISQYVEYALVDQYVNMYEFEKRQFNMIKSLLEGGSYPIWTRFLDDVAGIGPALAGVIISELDPHKARHASSFWAYTGLDVAQDGRGRSMKKEHLVDREYTDKDGEIKEKKSITFNPFLKAKMIGVLGTSFLRVKEGSYKNVYYDYKNRLENSPAHEEKSKGHRHNMAIRYMVKMFLADLWVAWRKIENLPVTEPYSVAKLGMKKHGEDAA